jgi:hypothetical protein
MFYSSNQSYHWKLNQSDVAISGRLANQIVRIEPIRRGLTCNTSASEQYIHFFIFFSIFLFFFISFFFQFFFLFLISVLLFLIFFFIHHFQQVTTQNYVQWLSLPRDFLRAWWLIVRFWYIFHELSIYNDVSWFHPLIFVFIQHLFFFFFFPS